LRGIPRQQRLRAALIGAAVLLSIAGGLLALRPSTDGSVPPAPPSISQRLGERTWALAIPLAWLAAPMPGLREDDILDLLGTKQGERATASDVAQGLRVISSDERALIVELTDQDAAAIAAARARGLSLVPILRSIK
jgi:hypothetical protein